MYEKCKHIQRSKPVFEVNEELAKQITKNAATLPLFEKGLFENSFIRNYSLKRSELLKCRWREYTRNIESRVFAPFYFPDIRDLHFHNCDVRVLREDSHDHRIKLRPGPGVDYYGQIPIPQDLLMKRSSSDCRKQPGKGAKDRGKGVIYRGTGVKDGGKGVIDGGKGVKDGGKGVKYGGKGVKDGGKGVIDCGKVVIDGGKGVKSKTGRC